MPETVTKRCIKLVPIKFKIWSKILLNSIPAMLIPYQDHLFVVAIFLFIKMFYQKSHPFELLSPLICPCIPDIPQSLIPLYSLFCCCCCSCCRCHSLAMFKQSRSSEVGMTTQSTGSRPTIKAVKAKGTLGASLDNCSVFNYSLLLI